MDGHISDDHQSQLQADSQPATIDEQVGEAVVREKIPIWEWEDGSIHSWLCFPPEAEEKLEALFSGPSTQSLYKEVVFEMTQYGHTGIHTVDLHENCSDSDGNTVWWKVDNATRSKQRVRRSEVDASKVDEYRRRAVTLQAGAVPSAPPMSALARP